MIASGESGMAVKNPEETKGWWYEVTWACSRYIVVTGIAVVDPKDSRTEVLVSPLRYLSVVVGLTTGACDSLAPDAP